MNTVESGTLLMSEWLMHFFRAVPPHWCEPRRTFEVMLGNVSSTVFENRPIGTCGCGKVETGLFLCSGLEHVDLLQVTVWLERAWPWEAELILLYMISSVSLEQVAYILALPVVNYLQFIWSKFLFLFWNDWLLQFLFSIHGGKHNWIF